ncbi:MAG: TolC family outer membrane protein [Proteobacteria bacterium]|nr:TolC family outer membrane protein [Pseudomonadota bacterium]MDA0994643.1 TolC family outer membrane protein [Pseudomonadota bacterium]
MKFKYIISLLFASGFPGVVSAASLLEVYQQALQSDPLIHEAEARRMATFEAVPQARGSLFPQLRAGGAWASGSNTGLQSFQQEVSPGVVEFRTVEAESDFDTFGWNAELRQTIFRWDQFVGLKQATKRVAKAEVDFEAAQQDLIVRVVTRYFAVLGAEDRLTSIHADRTAIARQLEQAKQRFDVGLIAITDVQESQAAYDQSIASEIQAKRELATARELLREITGEYTPVLSAPGEQFPLLSPAPADEGSWIDMAMDQNLALVSSRFDEEIARDEISYRKTGHYPTIDFVANYDTSDTDISNVRIGGALSPNPSFPTDNTRDSISVQFSVPLFEGGKTSSRVREAIYLHRASREQLQRVARETERRTRDAYLGVLSEISRVNALGQAVASSRTALEATQAGFEVGTRTIVDVLNSQRSLYIAITNYYQSRYTYIGNVLSLKLAAGTLQIQDLEQIDRFLSARRPPEEVIAEEENSE